MRAMRDSFALRRDEAAFLGLVMLPRATAAGFFFLLRIAG